MTEEKASFEGYEPVYKVKRLFTDLMKEKENITLQIT